MIKETPKLVKRFTGVGSRKVKRGALDIKLLKIYIKLLLVKGKQRFLKIKRQYQKKK